MTGEKDLGVGARSDDEGSISERLALGERESKTDTCDVTNSLESPSRPLLPSYVRGTHGAFVPVWELQEGHPFKDRHTMDFITEFSPRSLLDAIDQHPLYEDDALHIQGTAMTLHRPTPKLDLFESLYVFDESHKNTLMNNLSNSRPKSGLPTMTVSRQRAEWRTPRGPLHLEALDFAKEKRRLTTEKRRRRRVSPSLSITSGVSELSQDDSITVSHMEDER